MTAELFIDGVSVRYGTGREAFDAVRDVTLRVPGGSVLGIVGESGSGKSTLAKAVIGLEPIRTGRIQLGDVELRGRRARRRIQMVFQDPYSSLNPRMTIGESIAEGLRLDRGTSATPADMLDLVGLPADRTDAYPRDFSGGQRQRIALARAIAAGPEVLIADEITSALDVSVQGSVINLLMRLRAELGFSVLFISHDLPVVRYVSDAIAVMYRGEVVEVGSTEQIVQRPAEEYTRGLLSAFADLTRTADSARGLQRGQR